VRAGIIVNPIAGRPRQASARVALARRLARAAGSGVELAVCEQPGHAAALAERFRARAYDVVVAWGGDGTVNEVAGPLVGSSTALGVVPAGSGNGFARGLRLPRDPEAALRTAFGAGSRAIDVGQLGPRHFLNVAGIGFDAAVAELFAGSRRRGGLTYVRGGLLLALSYRAEAYRLELRDDAGSDVHGLDREWFLMTFANGPEYGNGAVIAADADPADGRLEVVLVEPAAVPRLIWRARRLIVGARRPARGIVRLRACQARVTAGRLVCHVDGEPFHAASPLDVSIRPRALLVKGA
jgi:YegS/Rv2252/BmrU family lipid kinase